jgi:glycosyltransferase involved in cell wall biosynthesis
MRVLHVHSGNLYGGVETTLVAQARHANLYPEMQLSFALCFEGRFSKELIDAGTTISWLDKVRIRNPLTVRRVRRALNELLQREAFDVIVTHSCWSQAIFGPVVCAAGIPLIFYLHGPANGRHWLELWARRTLPDLVVCNSRFTAATVHRLYPLVPAEIVYCPVAPLKPNHSEADINRTRADLKTPKDATVIIQVSRMEEGKGQTNHLEALSLLKDLPNWVCWLVGSPQRSDENRYLQRLQKMARSLGIAERVSFVDQSANVGELLAAADIFCQPHTGPESFGIVFIEALYAQLPVVTTAIGGACEIVDDSCGVLVRHRDARALANALKLLIENRSLRRTLGTAGPAKARALSDVSSQMRQLENCYFKALNGNGKTSGETPGSA